MLAPHPFSPSSHAECMVQSQAETFYDLKGACKSPPSTSFNGSYTWAEAEALQQQPREGLSPIAPYFGFLPTPAPVPSSVSAGDGSGRSLGQVLFGFAHPPSSLLSLVCLLFIPPLNKRLFSWLFFFLFGFFLSLFLFCFLFVCFCVGVFLVLFCFLVYSNPSHHLFRKKSS